jgi:2-dehydro-3-deoxygluconokinase
MLSFPSRRVVAIGEVMIEMAPVGDGLYRRGYAGDTFNTAWHMGQLLGDAARVAFVTRVGRDPLSDAFVAEMEADGLDVSGVVRDPERNMGLYLIELDGVERSFHYWRASSAARRLADDPVALAADLSGAGLLHLSGITLAILSEDARKNLFRVLEEARAGGAIVAFDPNIRPRLWSSLQEMRETVMRMLSMTDIALPSFDDEAANWSDAAPSDTIDRLVSLGVREVVVKNGAESVRFYAGGSGDLRATPAVEGIRDTTGAGDAFNAGYLSARLLGYSPVEAVAAGQSLSSEVIRNAGARAPKEWIRSQTGVLGQW